MGARNVKQRVNRIRVHTVGAVALVLVGVFLLGATLIDSDDPAWGIGLALGTIGLGLTSLVSCLNEVSHLALTEHEGAE
jgi:hypothetical protein